MIMKILTSLILSVAFPHFFYAQTFRLKRSPRLEVLTQIDSLINTMVDKKHSINYNLDWDSLLYVNTRQGALAIHSTHVINDSVFNKENIHHKSSFGQLEIDSVRFSQNNTVNSPYFNSNVVWLRKPIESWDCIFLCPQDSRCLHIPMCLCLKNDINSFIEPKWYICVFKMRSDCLYLSEIIDLGE